MTRKSLRTKRIFSIILSLAVVLTMMPVSAFAAGDAAVQAEGNVAEVTTANGTSLGQYATLADAIKAAQGSGGSTVKLLADIKTNYHKETKDGNTWFIYTDISGTYTLDLNGYTVNGSLEVKDAKSNLTIKNSKGTGKIDPNDGGNAWPALTVSQGSVTIESGNFAKRVNCKGGATTIKGGIFEKRVICNDSRLTINGGAFKDSVTESVYAGSGSTAAITAGQFASFRASKDNTTVSISGGSFDQILCTSSSHLHPAAMLASGYAFADRTNGKKVDGSGEATISNIKVVKADEIHAFVASVTAGASINQYQTFEEALRAAQGTKDSVLTLLDDITTAQIPITDGDFVLDLNGKKLSGADSAYLIGVWLTNSNTPAKLTIRDSAGNGTIENTSGNTSVYCNGGDVTIEGGTLKGCLYGEKSGKITIKGGTFSSLQIGSEGVLDHLDTWVDAIAQGKALAKDGKVVRADVKQLNGGPYTVIDHTHSCTYNKDTFEVKCSECGYVCKEHTYSDGKCSVCGQNIVAQDGSNFYVSLNEAFANVVDKNEISVTADLPEETLTFNNNKDVTLDLNNRPVKGSADNAAILTVADGKLTVINSKQGSVVVDYPAVITNSGKGYAVSVTGGTLAFGGKVTLTGGLQVIKGGKLEGGLKEGSILIDGTGNAMEGGSASSVSVRDSVNNQNYGIVLDLLGEGLAFAKYDESAENKAGAIVNGNVNKLTEDVIVVPCTHKNGDTSLFKNGTCTGCGLNCSEHDFVNGVCSVCGYVCPHTDVNDQTGKCNVCQAAMVAKVTLGEATTYYTDVNKAITSATDGSTVTLLETVHLSSSIRVENAAGITLDLNGKTLGGRTIKVGGVNPLNQPIPGKLTVIDSSNGNGRIGLEINDGGTLEFKPGNKLTTLSQLQVYGSANVKLYGGKIEKTNDLTLGTDIKMNNLLPDGYAYKFYIGESMHESLDYMKAAKNDLSGWKSGYNLVPELCDHTKLESNFNEANCPYCNSALAATVTKDSKTTGYTNAQNAVNNANGGTVKLLTDVNETLTISTALKLDCNGHSITTLTVSDNVTLESLLPEGYAFKSNGTWVSDLSAKKLENVTNAEAPIKSVTAVGKSNITVPYGTDFTLAVKIAWTGDSTSNNLFKWTETTTTGYELASNILTLDGHPDNSRTMDITISKAGSYPAQTGIYTYWATFTKDGYSKSCEFVVTVNAKALTDAMVGTVADQTYDGNAKTPDVTVKDGETTLVKDKDYTVVYANNTNAGEATATITGIGNYTGQAVKKFTIKQKALSEVDITVADGGTYDEKEKTPTVIVKDGDKTLTAGTDYTPSYENNINAGVNTAKVTVTGEGNYSGEVVKNFSIAKADYVSGNVYEVGNTYVYSDGGDTGNFSLREFLATGASYMKDQATMTKAKLGEDEKELLAGNISWSDDTNLSFKTKPCPADYKATLTIPVNGGQNYNNYEVVYTITVVEKNAADVTITGLPEDIKYGDKFTLSASQVADQYYYENSEWSWNFDTTIFEQVGETKTEVIEQDETHKKIINTITLKAIKAGDVTADIKAFYESSEYKGSSSVTVNSIEKKALSKDDFNIPESLTKSYDGTDKHTENVEISLKDSSKVQSSDTLTFAVKKDNIEYDNASAGKATKATLTLPDISSNPNYKFADDFATIVVDASITAKPITIASATAKNRTYTKGDSDVDVDVTFNGLISGETLEKDTDYTVNGTMEDANAGDNKNVNVTVTLKNSNYSLAKNTTTTKVKIKAKAVEATVTVEKESFIYNGKAHEPKVVVKDGNTTIAEKEYTVSYANNTNAGKATVTITDKEGGNYVVSGDTNFIIARYDISTALVQVIFEKSLTYNGEPQRAQIKSLTAGGLQMTSDDYKLEGNTATAAGTHEMTITGEGNFTGRATTEFTIAQATVTTTDKPTQNTVYEGTEVSKVTFKEKKVTVSFNNGTRELEGTWSVVAKDGAMEFDKTGKYTCEATFTPSDKNFAPITMDVEITVTNRPSGGGSLPTTEVVTIDKVTTSPAEVKNETKTDADGTKKTISKVTVSDANQKEIIKQVKDNKSEEIVINVSEKEVADNAKLEISLDKDFIDSIVKDTDAKLTIKTPEGDKTFTQEELKKLSESAAADGTITVDPTASEPTDITKAEKITKAKGLIEKLNLMARSSKTAKKNAKVILKRNETTNSCIKELKDLGFTVKYRFYRSTKKSAGYKSTVTKKTASYMNTNGKKGTKYFYKIQIRVYDENGKLIAKTALKQCKYASRIWSK